MGESISGRSKRENGPPLLPPRKRQHILPRLRLLGLQVLAEDAVQRLQDLIQDQAGMGVVEANLAGHRFVQVVAGVRVEVTPGEDRVSLKTRSTTTQASSSNRRSRVLRPGMAMRGGAARRLKATQTRLK